VVAGWTLYSGNKFRMPCPYIMADICPSTNDQTGGQDDLLTIFSPWEQRVIARCQGHSSFVSSVAFDDLRCDGRTYRFGSVGEDNKLILVSPLILFTKCVCTQPGLVGFFKRCTSPTKTAGQLRDCSLFSGTFSNCFHIGYPSPANVNVIISFPFISP
jgi:hypothetical protein